MKEKTLAKILAISVGVILIIGILIFYKLYLLNEYCTPIDTSYLENVGEIKVQTIPNTSNSTIEKMNLYLSENLEKAEMDETNYTYKSERGLELWISYWTSDIVSDWKEHSDKKEINFDKLANKENIKTGYDMFNYLTKHYDDKPNLFSGINKMYMYYWSRNSDADIASNSVESASLITGDLKGYYLAGKNFNVAKIFNGDSIYIIRFNKTLYTEEEIKNTLNSITFE